MMRIRSIKPEFWSDRITGRWDVEMKLLYIALWNVADDEGRFEYEPEILKANLFPFGMPFDLEQVIGRLESTKKLRRYVVAGLSYCVIPSLKAHQWQQKRKDSKLPAPPDSYTTNGSDTVHQPCGYGSDTVYARSGRGREGVGKDQLPCAESLTLTPAQPPGSISPVLAVLPCVGRGPKEFLVSSAQVAEWSEAYPGIDVLGEIRKARAWLDANKPKRKTHRGIPAFLVNWFGRAQNSNPNRKPTPNANPDHDQLVAALADAERYHATGEPPAGDGRDGRGVQRDGPIEGALDGVAEASAPLPPEERTTVLHRWAAGLLQDSAHVEPGAGHGASKAAGPVRVA